MKRRTLVLFLLALTIFSLSGCTKDKPEETTAPTLEVIEPETTEPEVLETLPEAETRAVGDGKSLEELSEEAGIPVIETRALNDESLLEDGQKSSKENSTNVEGASLLVQNPLHLVKILLNLALTLLNLMILQIMTLDLKQVVNQTLKIQSCRKIMAEIQK